MATELPPTIDPVAAARWQAAVPAASPWLHEEVARRMQQRLDWIKRQPARWAHWGPVQGGLEAHALIARRYPDAECHLVEPAGPKSELAVRALNAGKRWWNPAHWGGPAARVVEAVTAHSVQLVWSNMALHLAADPQALLAHWHDALADDGFLMFSCLGPDTVRELHALYRALGWGEAGHAFTDMHDWGDMLLHAGFAEPVMDMERITLSYGTPASALAELRGLGRNLHPRRFAGLRTRGWRDRLERELASRLSDPSQEGRLALTFEIVYGHAFKPVRRAARGKDSRIELDEMRAMLKSGQRAPAVSLTPSQNNAARSAERS